MVELKEAAEIEDALKRARKYNLEAEVVWSFLRYGKAHRERGLDTDSATLWQMALDDWDL